MPIIYTEPVNLGTNQFTNTGGTTSGSLVNLADGNPRTSFTTNTLTFTATITPSTSVDTLYVLGTGIDTVTAGSIASAVATVDTYDNRKAFIATAPTPFSVGSFTVTLTGDPNVTIYHMFLMRRLINLQQSGSLAITRFEKSGQMRNSFPVPDLNGNTVLQTDANSWIHPQLSYQIWQRASNLTAARNIVTKNWTTAADNPNIVLWDLAEPNAMDHETVYRGHWSPSSFTQEVMGTNVVQYSFSITI